ncbi:MAG TPA: PAS domain-containing protein [Blastocatellia bacterium]|nr:PAS domain-containing protein [Blastocatellia bacterium]
MSFPLRLILFALAYWAGAELSYALLEKAGNFSVFWPPVGIYLGMLLATPRGRWWAVVLAAAVPNLWSDVVVHQQMLGRSLGFLLVNVSAPLLAAALLARLCRPALSFARLRHITLWSLIASFVSTPLGALGGAALIVNTNGGAYAQKWFLWWVGDLLGVLALTPLTYGLLTKRAWWRHPRVLEAAALLLSLSVATVLLFRLPMLHALPPTVLYFFLLWAALRFDAALVAAATTVLAVFAMWLTGTGYGPYILTMQSPARAVLAQIMAATGALLFYILAAVMAERRAAADALHEINTELDGKVRARTAELAEAHQQLQFALKAGGLGDWRLTLPDLTMTCSDLCRANFGVASEDEFTYSILVEMVHPEDRARQEAAVNHALATGEEYAVEYRITTPQGETRWIEAHGRAAYDADGQPLFMSGTTQNITARKQAEAALRESEEHLRYTVEFNPQVPWTASPEGSLETLSSRWLDITGLTHEEALGTGWLRSVLPEDLPQVQAAMVHSLTTGEPYRVKYRIHTADGAVRWMYTRAFPRRNEVGDIVRWYGTTEDIHEQQAAEEEVRRSNELFSTLATHAPVGIFRTDADGYCIYVNEWWVRITDLSFADALGTGWTKALRSNDRERVWAEWSKAARNNLPFSAEYCLVNLEGKETIVIGQAIAEKDVNGKVLGYIGTITDITKRKEQEAALAEAHQQLSQERQRLALALTTGGLGVYEWQVGAEAVWWSPETYALFGVNPATFTPTVAAFDTLVHPDDRAELWRKTEESLHNNQIFKHEYRIVRPDGTLRWIFNQSLVQPMASGGGRVTGIVADITERRQAEEERQKFVSLVEQTSDFVGLATMQGDTLYVNPAGLRMAGLAHLAEARGRRVSDYHPAHLQSFYAETVIPHIQAHGVWEGETQLRNCQNDAPIDVYQKAQLIRPSHPGAPSFVATTIQDISERKRAEARLHASHETFRHLVENSPFGIFAVNADFQLAQMSAGAQKVFANVHPLIGRDFAEVLGVIWPEPFASEAIGQFRHTLATGEPYHSPSTVERRSDIDAIEAYDWKIERITLPDGRFGVVCHFYDLSERQRYEAELRASEERLRLAIEAAEMTTWQLRLSDGMRTLGENYAAIVGAAPATSEEFKALIHPEDRLRFQTALAQTIQVGAPFKIEYRVVTPSQELRWLSSHGCLLRDAQGQPEKVIGVAANITARRRHEQNLALLADLQAEFARLSTVEEITTAACQRIADYLNLSHCLFVEIDEAMTTATVIQDGHTAAFPSLVGKYEIAAFHTEEERRELSAGRAVVIHDVNEGRRPPEAAAAFAALGIGALLTVPYQSQGRWMFVLSAQHSHPYQWRDDERELLRELTARTYLRVERARAEARLRESEERYRGFVQASAQIVWRAEADGSFTEEQPSWAEFTGQSVAEYRGAGWANVLHPDDRARVTAAWQAAITRRSFYEIEERIRHKDGTYRWVQVRAVPLLDATGAVREWVGASSDITARKQLELEREQVLAREQQARQLAEEANRAKDNWLAMVTHELRSPLNAILGHARLFALRRADLTPEWSEFVDLVRRNGERQNELINDLLDTARMATGKLRLEPGPVKLSEIVNDALDTVRPSAIAKKVALLPKMDADIGTIVGDAARLQQVVWNLLTNAVKFTPVGGSVLLRLHREAEQIRLTISDTGQGIEPEFLPHVFERFSQADTSRSRRFGGLGLGLALVKQIVELHGGSITATSAGVGQGATFTVTLPARMSEDMFAAPIESGDMLATETAAQLMIQELQGVEVLLVEDEADARTMVTELLTGQGATVRTAATAAAAWPFLTGAARPRILVCDIGLPEEDGYSLLTRLRQWECAQEWEMLPALALTAHNSFQDRLQALTVGFQMHIAKPVNPEELLLVLRSVLERWHLSQTSAGE